MTAREVTDARRKLGMNQAQFAKHLKLSEATVSRWESGERMVLPYAEELIRLKLEEHQRLLATLSA